MFQVSVGGYSLKVGCGLPSASFGVAKQHAGLVDELGVTRPDSSLSWIEVRRSGNDWPFLVVVQRYAPGLDAGFCPGVLVVPETGRLFLGAGERLLAYDLRTPKRLWEDAAEMGFWSWARHDDVVVISAELEIAAWNLEGRKLWSRFVEPPWEYRVENGLVRLDVMGTGSAFDLYTGPTEAS
ncbi:MAG: hypothetical protein J0I07_06600 [Myxococcales bacterium]|nr:hypothetical protein [Myxococcales bacterium]